MFNVETVRKDFPILERKVRDGKPLTYLDNAATTHKPRQVVDAMSHFYLHSNANVHRSIHELGEEATNAYVGAHEKVARFVNARGLEEIVFTKNATEALNAVAYAWGLQNLEAGDEVVVSLMEHHSMFVPFQQIAATRGASLKIAPVTAEGTLDLDGLQEQITPRTKIVAITGMSNVLGTITPVKEWAKMARDAGAVSVVDAAQLVPHAQVDVQDMGVDFMAFSGHKMLGPTGIGVLYGKRERLEEMPPFLFGGEMIRRVSVEETTWNDLPWKFEAGTPNIAEGVGLGAAVDYLSKLGMDAVHAHEQALTRYAFDRLNEMGGVKIYGPPADQRGGVVSFEFEDANGGAIHAHDLASLLDEDGVAIRAGHHCAQPLMTYLDVPSTARASFYVYNTKAEVDALVASLEKARKVFGS